MLKKAIFGVSVALAGLLFAGSANAVDFLANKSFSLFGFYPDAANAYPGSEYPLSPRLVTNQFYDMLVDPDYATDPGRRFVYASDGSGGSEAPGGGNVYVVDQEKWKTDPAADLDRIWLGEGVTATQMAFGRKAGGVDDDTLYVVCLRTGADQIATIDLSNHAVEMITLADPDDTLWSIAVTKKWIVAGVHNYTTATSGLRFYDRAAGQWIAAKNVSLVHFPYQLLAHADLSVNNRVYVLGGTRVTTVLVDKAGPYPSVAVGAEFLITRGVFVNGGGILVVNNNWTSGTVPSMAALNTATSTTTVACRYSTQEFGRKTGYFAAMPQGERVGLDMASWAYRLVYDLSVNHKDIVKFEYVGAPLGCIEEDPVAEAWGYLGGTTTGFTTLAVTPDVTP